MNVVQARVEPSPTLRLATQATKGAALQWSEHGPQLDESSHLRVCLEGHVASLLHLLLLCECFPFSFP